MKRDGEGPGNLAQARIYDGKKWKTRFPEGIMPVQPPAAGRIEFRYTLSGAKLIQLY